MFKNKHSAITYYLLICQIINCVCIGATAADGIADEVCTKNDQDCREHSRKWSPFVFRGKWNDYDNLLHEYGKWQMFTVYDSKISCEEKKAFVFTPNAGLGDSIGGLTGAFMHAIRKGRLFFINWKPNDWGVGLKELPFPFEFSKVQQLRDKISGKRLMCVDYEDEASKTEGHLTAQHPILSEPDINEVDLPYDHLLHALIQPSAAVQTIVDEVMNTPKPTDSMLVGIVIRTGQGEYNQFLSDGDEMNFVKCFRNFAKDKKKTKSMKFRVFVASDVDKVKKSTVKALKRDDELDVVTLQQSNVHMMHLDNELARSKKVKDKIQKTYAEYFIIAKCNVLFLTHGSLFGKTAAEHGVAEDKNIYFLSDSQCDGKREKYSYLECARPKFPAVCQL